LRGLNGREPADGGRKRRIEEENWGAEPRKGQLARRNDSAGAVITPMAASE
jgi:hypothetical protein